MPAIGQEGAELCALGMAFKLSCCASCAVSRATTMQRLFDPFLGQGQDRSKGGACARLPSGMFHSRWRWRSAAQVKSASPCKTCTHGHECTTTKSMRLLFSSGYTHIDTHVRPSGEDEMILQARWLTVGDGE